MPWTWWPAVLLIVLIGVFEVASGFDYVIYVPVAVFLVGFFIVPLVLTGRTRVRVQDGVVHAGKDTIRATELTTIQPLDRATTRLQLGPRADPAAHLLVRGWIPGSVMMRLSNPQPTPYWLVSSRRPDELAAAIKQARTTARSASR